MHYIIVYLQDMSYCVDKINFFKYIVKYEEVREKIKSIISEIEFTSEKLITYPVDYDGDELLGIQYGVNGDIEQAGRCI